jgi:hypothetical protein
MVDLDLMFLQKMLMGGRIETRKIFIRSRHSCMEVRALHDLQVPPVEHIPLMKCCLLLCWTLKIMLVIQLILLTAKALSVRAVRCLPNRAGHTDRRAKCTMLLPRLFLPVQFFRTCPVNTEQP